MSLLLLFNQPVVNATFYDSTGVNPLPGGTFVTFYAGSSVSGSSIGSGFLNASGQITEDFVSGSTITATFIGVQAPTAPLTFVWP